MHKSILFTSSIVALALAACQPNGSILDGETSSSVPSSPLSANVQVTTPQPGEIVSSPLIVEGAARGTWFFEASFPVRLLDGSGTELAVAPATASGDWMTTDFVPFSVTLTFPQPVTSGGTLVLEKDNPSGLPENAASVEIPVQF